MQLILHRVNLYCYQFLMRPLIVNLLIAFAILLGMTNVSLALPACPSSGYKHNCFGTFTWAAGSKYIGEFRDDKRNGWGTYTWSKGDIYIGEWRNNIRTGHGTYTFADGEKYVGEFKDNRYSGQGALTQVNGNKYVGEYKDDKRYGQGTYTWKDGRIWVGEWKNSELNGYAIKYYQSGDINQEGIFKDGKFLYAQNSKHPPCPSDQTENYHDCYGTYVFANGDTYVGEYKDNKYYGQGTYTYANGDKYVGEYKKGKQSGQGTTFFTSGAKYIGEYKDDKWYGQGTYYWADGRKDVGIFENDKLNGYAITYHADGSMKQQGIFKDDKFLYAQNSPSNNNQNTCNEDPALCTIVQLCSKASHYYGGKKKWQTNYSSKKYIIEAEKNGVSCGVNSEIAQSKKDEIFPAASGSGFFITKDGHIITNEHVIEGCQTVKVHQQGTSYASKILSSDKFNDLALIKIKYEPKVVFSLTTKPPYLGQDIIAAGYPLVSDLGNSLKVTSGIVSALSAIDDTSKFQMDVPVQPGNSGGPIFDVNGNILGVVVARSTHKETQLVNFGIKAATVRNLLDSNNIKLLPPNIEPINKREFSEAMTKGTVLLSCWMTLTQIDKANANNTGKVFFKEFQK